MDISASNLANGVPGTVQVKRQELQRGFQRGDLVRVVVGDYSGTHGVVMDVDEHVLRKYEDRGGLKVIKDDVLTIETKERANKILVSYAIYTIFNQCSEPNTGRSACPVRSRMQLRILLCSSRRI